VEILLPRKCNAYLCILSESFDDSMTSKRILVCSDFASYQYFTKVFENIKPDALLLAGDLTSDGGADFWGTEALEFSPDGKFLETEALRKRRISHVEDFYEVLRNAGKSSRVFVVKGDHDDDFEGSSFRAGQGSLGGD